MVGAKELQEAICGSIISYRAGKDKAAPTAIRTPFLDHTGDAVIVYLDPEGYLTDGGSTLSEMDSLELRNDWYEWPYRQMFMERYNLQEIGGELRPAATSTREALLAYVQGLSKVMTHFEIRVPDDAEERFTRKVRETATPGLVRLAPKDGAKTWIRDRVYGAERNVGGIPFKLDMNPLDQRALVQIVSYGAANPSAQRLHVLQKTNPFIYSKSVELERKQEPRHYRVAVIGNLDDYPIASKALLTASTHKILQLDKSKDVEVLVDVLGRGNVSDVLPEKVDSGDDHPADE